MTAIIGRILGKASGISRRSKALRVVGRLQPGSTVLLVGIEGIAGDPQNSNVFERILSQHFPSTALIYDAAPRDALWNPSMNLVRGDGRALPFVDGAFDYVVSNAVIEHVGCPDKIRKFYEESMRVARVGVVHTTPNRRFPLETHTGLPLLHWLPRRLHTTLLRNRRYSFTGDDYLLTRQELRRVVGGRCRTHSHPRLLGMTLLLMASKAEDDA